MQSIWSEWDISCKPIIQLKICLFEDKQECSKRQDLSGQWPVKPGFMEIWKILNWENGWVTVMKQRLDFFLQYSLLQKS